MRLAQNSFSTALLPDTPGQLSSLFPREAYSYIYALSDPRTKAVCYVGKTNSLSGRYWAHCRDKKRTPKALWIQDLSRIGLLPEIDIVDFCKADSLDWEELERKWISNFSAMGFKLLNSTTGGDAGRKYSAESCEKIRISAVNQSPEKRAAISKALLGRKRDPEIGRRHSLKMKGWKPSEEWKKKQSLAKLGKPLSVETKNKRAYMLGRVPTQEHRAKISEAKKAAFAARRGQS